MEKKQNEKGKSHGQFFIAKYASEEDYQKGNAFHEGKVGDNILLNEGINELFTLLCSSGGTKFDNTNAYLGVGDSSTAATAGQTGLQASSNKLYKGMESGYPNYGTNQKATWQSKFGGSDANFGWNEFTVANGNSDSDKNLDRLVSNQGSKTSGQVWTLSLEITIS